MALTEQVQLDIQNAQRQIDALERQLQGLSTPVNVPVNVTGGQELSQIRSELGLSEGAAEDLNRELSQTDSALRDTARAAGSAGDDIEDAGRRGTSTFRGLATVIGGVVAALGLRGVFSSVFGAGLDRFTTIEDATRALTIQLDDAAAAAGLLEDVLNVVRGTPFNLDQFASSAQQLVGFGVAIERIPGILTAIGEAAATQGGRAPEFVDRLVTVFGQITTTGRVALEDVNRIADTGVNALVILANAFGVTTQEMRDMISEGAIPAAEALDILTVGIVEGSDGIAGATVALGGTMEGLRETLSGARGGLQAALARLGESFFDVIGASSVEGLNQLAGAVDRVTASVRNLDIDTDALLRVVAGLPSAIGTAGTQISSGAEAFGNAFQVFGALARLDFGDLGVQFQNLGDDIARFREAPVANQAIQNLLTTLSEGVAPASALEFTLAELGKSVSTLTLDTFEDLAEQLVAMTIAAGGGETELAALADVIETFGLDAGFSVAGVQALADTLRGPLRDALITTHGEIAEGDPVIAAWAESLGRIPGEAQVAADAVENIEFDFGIGNLPVELQSVATALGGIDTAAQGVDLAGIAEEFANSDQSASDAAAAIDAYRLAVLALTDPAVGLLRAQDDLTEAQEAYNKVISDPKATPDDVVRATADLAAAQGDLLTANQALPDDLGLTTTAISELGEQAGARQEDIDLLIEALENLNGKTATAQIILDLVTGAIPDLSQGITAPGIRVPAGVFSGEAPTQGSVSVTQNFEGFTPSTTDLARGNQAINTLLR